MLRKTADNLVSSDWHTIEHALRKVITNPANPAETIHKNYEALLKNKSLANSSTKRGNWFEVAIIDALIQAGVETNRIEKNVHLNKQRNVEADIVVYPTDRESLDGWTFILMAKTSMRERWKQWDRDAQAIPYVDKIHNPLSIGIFYKEKETDTLIQCAVLSKKRQRMSHHMARIVSVLEEDRFNRLVANIKKM